jgi:hypothetical protein
MRAWSTLPWIIHFSVISICAAIAILMTFWVVVGFGSLGLDEFGIGALILGVAFTVGLGIGLMALTFYSDRSGQDDSAGTTRLARDRDSETKEITQ